MIHELAIREIRHGQKEIVAVFDTAEDFSAFNELFLENIGGPTASRFSRYHVLVSRSGEWDLTSILFKDDATKEYYIRAMDRIGPNSTLILKTKDQDWLNTGLSKFQKTFNTS